MCELGQQTQFPAHVRAWRQRFVGAPAPDRVEIGVAACSHHCNATLVHEIAVVARRHGYAIAIGGKADAIPAVARWLVEGVSPDRVPAVIDHVLDTYRRLARGRERLSRVVARVGVEPFVPPWWQPEAEPPLPPPTGADSGGAPPPPASTTDSVGGAASGL